LNARLKVNGENGPLPTANDEYLFYQTMIGAWPLEFSGEAELDTGAIGAFRDRLCAYMTKAVREAKCSSSWTAPNAAYEEALGNFVGKALAIGQTNPFLADFRAFHASIEKPGAVNGLAQTALKLTLPGVPDVYQGCELWDLSLVDPDNRRPVDYAARRRALADMSERFAEQGADAAAAGALLDRWQDGTIKLFLVWRLLALRRQHSDLFACGRYINLTVRGSNADHIFAFARRHRDEAIAVVVPRLTWRLAAGGWPLGAAAWRDTRVILPKELGSVGGRHVLTGADIRATARPAGIIGVRLPAAELFRDLPIAVVSLSLGG
jgi:(1->4)-alpha-D-glucan 1-alpha-D-glucosylmutase